MSSSQGAPTVSTGFVIATFAFAIIVGVLIAYLGITGQLGASIP
jgi:hypothetical protein